MNNVYLGISFGFHDSSVSIVSCHGQILFAASEERFSRIKGDKRFPKLALSSAINYAKINNLKILSLCYHENPLHRLGWSLRSIFYLRQGSKVRHFWDCLNNYVSTCESLISTASSLGLTYRDLSFSSHHASHAYSAYAFGEYNPGIVLIADAFGQDASGLLGYFCKKGNLRTLKQLACSQSIGLFYSSITAYCGFKVLTGEYKLMGLAPYGRPVYLDHLKHIFGEPDLKNFHTDILDIYDFNLARSLQQFFSFDPREPETEISQHYLDLACSAQVYLELLVLNIIDFLQHEFEDLEFDTLYFGGGVALNCKVTYLIESKYPNLTVQICPSAGDAGSSIGAAYNKLVNSDSFDFLESCPTSFKTPYLGNFENTFCAADFCELHGIKYMTANNSDVASLIVDFLCENKVVGVYQARSEFGPRALGNRSILANPQSKDAVSFVNSKIKSREDFRPLAPITTRKLFDICFKSAKYSHLMSYMLTLCIVDDAMREKMPSAVHVDSTARIQVLENGENKLIQSVLHEFHLRTSCPALINTSFNQRGEPIVETYEDAFRCFCSTGLAALLMDDVFIARSKLPSYLIDQFSHKTHFMLD